MSERYYRQQMDYFNIKSVADLGRLHSGDLVKREKRTPSPIAGMPKPKRLLKSDLVDLVSNYFKDPIKGLDKLTMDSLNDLLSALAFTSEDTLGEPISVQVDLGRVKAPYLKEIKDGLGIPTTYTLDLKNLTVATLKELLLQLQKGLEA